MANAPDQNVTCPRCGGDIRTDGIYYAYDAGCWRTANGDGWPESEDFEVEGYEACECGFDPNKDATPEEIEKMDDEAYRRLMEDDGGYDDGPEYEPDDYDDGPRSLF